MNESTGFFMYAISNSRDRCKYEKCEDVWIKKQATLKWVENKSNLDFDTFKSCNTVYLFMAMYVPGVDVKRFISCVPVDLNALKVGYTNNKLKTLTERLNESVEIHGHVPILNPLSNVIDGITCCASSNRLGENKAQRITLKYRGSWFINLWQYLYETYNGDEAIVVYDVYDNEYKNTKIYKNLSISTSKQISDDGNFKTIEIETSTPYELISIFNELKHRGNIGHSFCYTINNHKLYYDGDGPDYIKSIS